MKAFRNWTLRGRLAALLVATLVPLTGLTAFWIFWEVREERTRLQGEVQNMAELIASQAAQSVAGVYERLGILARSPAVRAGNRQEIEKFFRNLLPHAPHLQNLGLVASDGMVLASAVPLPQGRPVSLKDREWFQRVLRWGEPAAGGFQIGRVTGNPNVILAHPVLDEKEELTGVVFAALDLAHVSRTVTWAYPGVPLLWAIVDEQGMVLLHSRPETTSGKPLAPLPGMIRGETVVPGTRWHSIVGMPEEMASAQVRQAFLRMGLPAGLILLLGAMLSLWIARNTWRPLRALTVAVRQVGLGNSDVRTPVHAGGEVGELTTTFAETLAALDRRRLELASLLQASRAMVSSLDLEQSLQAIVRQAASISGAPAIRLFLLDEDTQVLRYRVGIGLPPEEERNRVVQVGESFSGQVAATGKPLVVSDTRGDSRLIYPEHVVRFGLVSYLGLPVKVGNRVIGVLIINTTAPRTYSEEEIAFLSVFADQAAIAIENARLYSATVRREAELEALLRATRSVMAGLDLHESLDRIVEEASRIAGTPHVKVLLRESETHALRVGAVAGHPGAMFAHRQYPPTASLSGIVAATGQPLFTPDSQNDSRNPHGGMDRELGLVTYLGLPIKSRGEVVGVLTFNTEAPHEYTPEEIAYLTSFADQAAIAIENARLHETTVRRAQQLATLNELTRKLTTVLEPQRVAEEILAAVQALIPEAAGRLWERVEETDRFRVVASLGLRDPEGGRHEFRAGEGLIGRATATRQPAISPDIASDTRLVNRAWLVAEGRASGIVLPLFYGERVTGALGIFTSAPHIFSDEEVDLLRSFAAQAAIAIENARLHTAAVHRGGELQALLRATRTVMSGLDLKGTLDRIIQEAAQISGIPHVKVVLVDKEAGVVRVAAGVGRPAEMFEGFAVPLGAGTSGRVAATGEPLFIADCQNDPRNSMFADQDRKLGIVTYLGLPIKVRDEVLGVLTFNTTEPHEYTPEEIAYLTSFADQAAVAIENARLFAAADHRATELATLREVGQAITGRLDLSGVLEAVVSGAMRILGNPFAQIILWDEATQRLSFGAALGPDAERIRNQTFEMRRGINGMVAHTCQPMIVEDYQASPYAVPECADVVATITVPILFGGRLLGVLHSHTTERGRHFSRDDLRLFQMLASQAAVAIENARLYDTIRRHAADLEARVRARTAELEEALRVKVEFLAKMSHELRTPLNFVIGFSELLQQEVGGPLTPKQVTYVDRIHNGGKRLLQLISDILDITQVDAGKSGLHLEPVIVSSLVQEVLGAVQVQVAQKRLNVTTALDPWLPFIVADRFKLAQVLRNLVENAVKFTPEGGAIRVVTRQGAGAGSRKSDGEGHPTPPDEPAEVIVEDTGIGIRPESLEAIFGPFYQVDGSEIRAYGGAGLGLALVRKLVELHGGRVWAESEGPNRGARFIVRLPRLEAPRAKRILLVEDEHLLRVPMTAALENAGFSVVQAATKAEALTAMEAAVPDLLILDILLPDGDGWEILRHVREAEEIRTLPVLVVTALETVHAEQALARGADEFLTKPVSPRVLVDTVARLLGQLGGESSLMGQGAGGWGEARESAARMPERGHGCSNNARGGSN